MVFKLWVHCRSDFNTERNLMVGLEGPDSSLRIASKSKQRRNQQQKVECEDHLEQQQYH